MSFDKSQFTLVQSMYLRGEEAEKQRREEDERDEETNELHIAKYWIEEGHRRKLLAFASSHAMDALIAEHWYTVISRQAIQTIPVRHLSSPLSLTVPPFVLYINFNLFTTSSILFFRSTIVILLSCIPIFYLTLFSRE